MKKKICSIFIIIVLVITIFLCGCSNIFSGYESTGVENSRTNFENEIKENAAYSSPNEVANYVHMYGKLPSNFITKKKAELLGWESNEGNLWEVTDKMSIGGDVFSNREKKLPVSAGRKWYECDVNYNGGYRGAERILYSSDELIYYTDDHYETFTELY